MFPSRSSSGGGIAGSANARGLSLTSPWSNALAVIVATLTVGGPLMFTRNGFAGDLTNHLWLVWVQATAISRHGVPTYFINAPKVGVLYPFYEFYGGTLYAVTGGLAAVVGGDVILAFVAVTLTAIAAAYGGLLWLARQLGVRGWMAHAPAVTYVCSAYYVTNLYGRGAWPEVIATSAIPLLAASGFRLAGSPRLELAPAVLFVLSAVFFAGSHNVTLILGTGVLAGGLILLRLTMGKGIFRASSRRVLEICALLTVAVAVNAWFLLPDALHASKTQIGHAPVWPWSLTSGFDAPGVLFDPLRRVPTPTYSPGLYVQAPIWFLLWSLSSGGLLWSRSHASLRRAAAALLVALAAILALIMIGPLWDAMPRLFREVQLPYRLNTYVAMCVAGLVLVAALALQRAEGLRRGWMLKAGLSGAAAISIGLCLWQLWVPNPDQIWSYHNRDRALVSQHVTPSTWYDTGDYADAAAPFVSGTSGKLVIPPSAVNANHVDLTVSPPVGAKPFATNIAAGAYAAKLSGGLVRVGRTQSGFTVARRTSGISGPVSVELEPAGGSIFVGEMISLASLVVLLVGLAIWASEPLERRLRSVRISGPSIPSGPA